MMELVSDAQQLAIQKAILSGISPDKTIIVMHLRDRGISIDFHQKCLFDADKIASTIETNHLNKVNSFYKKWLLYETHKRNFAHLNDILDICQIDLFRLTAYIKNSYYESYGCVYSLFVILEQLYLKVLTADQDSIMNVIERLYFCFNMYTKYHAGKEKLFDAEIFANMGRVSRYFDYYYPTLIACSGNTNIVPQYLFIYFFQMASHLTPIETGLKYDYHATSFMMHQNQTVCGVTNDAFEYPWNKTEQICGSYVDAICHYVEQKYLVCGDKNIINIQLLGTENLNSFFKHIMRPRTNEEQTIIFDIYNQIESYSEHGYIQEPFVPTYFHVNTLLENIGESNICVATECQYSLKTNILLFCEETSVKVLNIGVSTDENQNLEVIDLWICGEPKHKWNVFNMLKRTKIFKGIPVYPISAMNFDQIVGRIFCRVLFRNNFDFGFDMLK